jgi:hypothetical protein
VSQLRIEANGILQEICQGHAIKLLLCSERSNHFENSALAELVVHPQIRSVTFEKNLRDAVARQEKFDVALILTHWVDEVAQLRAARRHNLADLYVLWIWDNHIAEDFHRQVAALGDLVIPAHGFNTTYLKGARNIVLPSVSIPSVQWDIPTSEAVFTKSGYDERSDDLYGAYFTYKEFPERERLLRACVTARISEGIFLREANEANRDTYFHSNAAERLKEWMVYKTSICLPLKNDLSSRLFDALVAGQIPIVPRQTADLDQIIPPEIQEWLPIIRFDEYTVDNVQAAHREAIRRFDLDKSKGALRRHRYAIENHMARHRMLQVVQSIFEYAKI